MWTRHPVGKTGYANYQCISCPNVWVRWCGHPTALRKYYVTGVPALEGRTYRTSLEAKTAAEHPELDVSAPGNKSLAQRKSDAPLRPAKAQQPCDIGLFSDDMNQRELR